MLSIIILFIFLILNIIQKYGIIFILPIFQLL